MIRGPFTLARWTSTVVEPPTIPVNPTSLVDLVWHDTPDHYTTATMGRFWDDVHADCLVLPTSGYLGGGAWSGSSEDAYAIAYLRELPPASETFGLGLRLRLSGYPSSSLPLVALVDDAGVRQVEVRIHTDGTLRVYRDSTEIAAGTVPLPTYSEIKFGFRGRVSPTVGEVEVLVAYGTVPLFTPVVRLTGINTASTGLPGWTGLYLGCPPAWATSHAYAGFGGGELRPGYLVRILEPDSVDASDWAASSGDIPADITSPPDDDASYIYANAVGDRYLVKMAAMPATRAIYGVRTVALVQDMPGRTVSHSLLVSNGTTAVDVSPWRSVRDDAWVMVDRFDHVHPLSHETWVSATVTASGFGGEVAA